MFKLNDIVKIKFPVSEFESSLVYKIININNETKRVQILALNTNLTFSPVELVRLSDIELININ